MPSLIDRVTKFGRSPKGQSVIRQAMNRFGGGAAKGGAKGGRGHRVRGSGRRGAGRR